MVETYFRRVVVRVLVSVDDLIDQLQPSLLSLTNHRSSLSELRQPPRRSEVCGLIYGHECNLLIVFARMDLPFRPRAALQPLSTNAPLASPTPMSYKPDTNSTAFPFFNKENDIMPFQLRQPNNMQGFFSHQRHAMQPTGFNPLCVQPQDNFSYLYSGSSYENPGPTDTAFQSFNGMNFDMNASQHFSPAPPQDPHDTNEFDI